MREWNVTEWALWDRLKLRWFTRCWNFVAHPVSNGASSVTITFPGLMQNVSYGVHCLGTWSTTMRVPTADKLVNQVTIRFGTAAPSADETVDVCIFRSEF